MRLRRALAALVLAHVWSAGPAVAADGAPGSSAQVGAIAILCAPGDRLGLRVAAELSELGFATVLLDPGVEPASRVSLEASARRVGAIAAVRAVPSEHGVEVWIADRVTGKTLLRELSGAGADPEGALALRTVELLRASLLEVSLPGAPPGEVVSTAQLTDKLGVPPPARPTPGSPAAERREAASLRASLSPGVLSSPGGLGAAPSMSVGLGWMFAEHGGVVAFTALPLAAASVERPEGEARLSVVLLGAAARLLPAGASGAWEPSVDVGVLGLSLQGSGAAKGGFAGVSSSSGAAAPFLRGGLALALTPTLRVRTDLLASAVAQGISLRVGGREAATWGNPLVLASVGLDLGWF